MINPTQSLSITHQARLLGISRGSVYYQPKGLSKTKLALMHAIDRLHMEHPFMGTRMLSDHLARQGLHAGRKQVGALMRTMGIHAIYRKPKNTSASNPAHKIFPYLLRHKTISPNQVWALDTSYIPMAKGFVYLTAVIDWATRKVLAHKVAITLEAIHAVDVLKEAFAQYDAPEIVNTDQGSQFTAQEFVDTVLGQACKFSMDGRGAWRDNVMIERLWRTVKYEHVYLNAYDSVWQAKRSLSEYLNWYNCGRLHSSLGKQTPNEVYENRLHFKLAA
jgi:putative transposase